MTAYAMTGDRERCLAAGMDAYVSKPIKSEELFQTIERLLPGPAAQEQEPKYDDTGDEDCVDTAAVLACTDGDEELARELVAMFLADSPTLLSDIHKAIASGDRRALESAAHTMTGAVSYVGSRRANEAALRLQTMGMNGDLNGVERALAELEKALKRIAPLLGAFCDLQVA
jgi:two-component system sensor histidine kinase/response regulator